MGLLKKPGIAPWDKFTVPMSMREVEAEVGLIMNVLPESKDSHDWKTPTQKKIKG